MRKGIDEDFRGHLIEFKKHEKLRNVDCLKLKIFKETLTELVVNYHHSL